MSSTPANNVSRGGFIEVMVVLILAVSLAVGSVYLKYSVQTFDGTIVAAHRIKARNLANAAFQKVLVTLKRRYAKGQYSWKYPGQNDVPDNQLNMALGDGRYGVVKVEVINSLNTPEGVIRKVDSNKRETPYKDINYRVGNADYGLYDIYRIETMGEIPASRTRVKMTSMVKMIREHVRY